MNTAFLLAAGLGTRLRPLTLHRPKALLPVAGVPMLEYSLALLRAHGHGQIVVNAHHHWEQVAAWAVGNGLELQVELPEILGTGGGLRAALPRLADKVVILNADILCDIDLSALLATVPSGGAAMALRALEPGEQISAVEADDQGIVRRIAGVVEGDGGLPGTHFTGVHAMTGEAIGLVPDGVFACVVRTSYKALIPRGRVAATLHAGTWVDVGSPEAYLAANLDVLAGRVATSVDPWSRAERGPGGSLIGVGAVVEGEVFRSVIGAGARVPGDARLEDCVVWDGVTVPAGQHRRAVVYTGGAVLAL